ARETGHKNCLVNFSCEKGHGRIEEREVVVTNQLDWLTCRSKWKDLTSLIEVTSRRTIKGKTTEERTSICFKHGGTCLIPHFFLIKGITFLSGAISCSFSTLDADIEVIIRGLLDFPISKCDVNPSLYPKPTCFPSLHPLKNHILRFTGHQYTPVVRQA
ncbi:MAG: hypothetical protein QG627_830, partial [Chlamydiota bacterium]|nr:hypothetical protein [Chlamydiota bacterium]